MVISLSRGSKRRVPIRFQRHNEKHQLYTWDTIQSAETYEATHVPPISTIENNILENESCQSDNFIVTGNIICCRYENLHAVSADGDDTVGIELW